MSLSLWLALLVAAVLISISPGAGAVNTMSNGLRYGVRQTLPAILGLQVGLSVQIVVVGIGLGAILASSTWAFTLLKWIGVAYLVWLGWQKWHEGPVAMDGPKGGLPAVRERFWQAVLVNLTNPKATVFLVSLFPQFLVPDEPHGAQFLVMGTTLIAVDVAVMVGYATLASQLQRFLRNPLQQRLMNRVFGGLFVIAAALMASFRRGIV